MITFPFILCHVYPDPEENMFEKRECWIEVHTIKQVYISYDHHTTIVVDTGNDDNLREEIEVTESIDEIIAQLKQYYNLSQG